MADGLDLFDVQETILAYVTERGEAMGFDVHEGDIADAAMREYVNGVNQTTWVIQFGDLLPSARSRSFCGPEMDGYYSLFRIFSIGDTPSAARQANSVANQLLIGYRVGNTGAVHKEGGGGAYALGEANTRPVAYGLISSYRFLTNIANPGGTIEFPPTP